MDSVKGVRLLSSVFTKEDSIDMEKELRIISNESNYLQNIYETMCLLKPVNEILTQIKSNRLGINSVEFSELHISQQEENEFIIKPFEVEEGILQCKECGSKKTYSYTKQVRSGDEGTSVFATCSQCGFSWRDN